MPGPFWEYDTSGSDHLRPCVDPRRRGAMTLLFKWLKQPVVLVTSSPGFLCSGNFLLQGFEHGERGHLGRDRYHLPVVLARPRIQLQKIDERRRPRADDGTGRDRRDDVPGFMAGRALGWTSTDSIFLGGMLSMSSTTIIIKAFDDLGPAARSSRRWCSGCWWSKTCSP